MSKLRPTIAVVMAMRAEARLVVEAVEAKEVDSPAPMPYRWWVRECDSYRLVIAINGVDDRHGVDLIGTEPAVLCTNAVVAAFSPDVVISAGTAGGWQRSGASVGDLYVGWPHVVRHDRRIDIARLRDYGIGRHAVWEYSEQLAAAIGARCGVVTTGNSLDESPTDRDLIVSLNGEVKEMEAAAVAWVCELSKTPFVAVKTITDLVDHPTPTGDQFLANLASASERLSVAVPAAAEWVARLLTSSGE